MIQDQKLRSNVRKKLENLQNLQKFWTVIKPRPANPSLLRLFEAQGG